MIKITTIFFKRLVLHTFILFVVTINAQNTTTDSLKRIELKKITELIKSSTPEEAKSYREQLINFPIENLLKAGELMRLGAFFYIKKESERSIYYMDEALKLFTSPKDNRFIHSSYFTKGNAYLNIWKNQEALNAYQKALKINEVTEIAKEEYEERAVITNLNIAIIRKRMKQLERAEQVYKTTLRFINQNKIKNTLNHANVLVGISELYLDLKQYDEALNYAHLGIEISDSIDYTKALAGLKTVQGTAFYYKKEYKKALEFLTASEKILIEDETTIENAHRFNTVYFQARCFHDQKLYREAITKLLEIVDLIKENEASTRVIEIYLLLAMCNKEIGDGNEAAKWYDKHIELNNQFLYDKDQTINKIIEKDREDLGQQIEELVENENKRNKDVKYILSALSFSIVILIIFLIFYFKKQQTNKIVFNDLIQKIEYLESQEKTIKKEETKAILIDDEKINEILQRLQKLEKQEYFLNLDCNLRSMAKKIKTNATYLSKIIHLSKEKNFNDYINDLRIDYVLKRLKNDRTFRLFSIKSIATEIGYKSDYSFAKHFKSKTGLNPSYYIKNINKTSA